MAYQIYITTRIGNQAIFVCFVSIWTGFIEICSPRKFVPGMPKRLQLEANHSYNRGVPLFLPTDDHPLSLSDLLQNHTSTIHTSIRAHA